MPAIIELFLTGDETGESTVLSCLDLINKKIVINERNLLRKERTNFSTQVEASASLTRKSVPGIRIIFWSILKLNRTISRRRLRRFRHVRIIDP